MRNVCEPQVGQKFVAFIWLLWMRKRFATYIVEYIVATSRKVDDLHIAAVFLGRFDVSSG